MPSPIIVADAVRESVFQFQEFITTDANAEPSSTVASEGPLLEIEVRRWKKGNPFEAESGLVRFGADADGEICGIPAAEYAATDAKAAPAKDSPITPSKLGFAAASDETVEAIVGSP